MASCSDDDRDAMPSTPDTAGRDRNGGDEEKTRQVVLEKELQGVRNINETIEGVIASLEKAKGNMDTVSNTVDNASILLNTWTRILSQTEHNQRLILNSEWKGATQDLIDIETEAIEKQQAAQQQAVEEERRRVETQRRLEEEKRQQRTITSKGARGTRSHGRGYARGPSSAARGLGSSNTRGISVGRGTRGIESSRYSRSRGPSR